VTKRRFKAFISYSHRNEDWARWLQRSLENYRIPARLIGKTGEFGAIPARVAPVFRDREDLSSATDLSGEVRSAMADSDSLVVICSPAAVRSRWVNDEIRYFRSLGRGDRIYALIVEGDPQADDEDDRCFPDALFDSVDGSVVEPLAADVRKWADGKRLARLKLVAGILGIRLDDLRRREMQRRRRNLAIISSATAVILALIAFLAITTIRSRASVKLTRVNIEELLGYMLGDLKDLAPIVGLEVIDPDDSSSVAYIDGLDLQQLSKAELKQRGARWRYQGLSFRNHGRADDALDAFGKSRAAYIVLYQKEPDTVSNLFELGQAEFWIGDNHWRRGNLDQAEDSFARYGVITRRLINSDPRNADYVMELSYTFTNLGVLQAARESSDDNKGLRFMQSALEYNQIALMLDPENESYRKELSSALAFLSDAWLETCDLGKAFLLRKENLELSREFLEKAPGAELEKRRVAFAVSGYARVQRYIGLLEPFIKGNEESAELLTELARESDNMELLWQAIVRKQMIARILGESGDQDAAVELVSSLVAPFDEMIKDASLSDTAMALEYALFRVDYATLLTYSGKLALATEMLQRSLADLGALVSASPDHRGVRSGLANAAWSLWSLDQDQVDNDILALLEGFLSGPHEARSCDDADLAARLAWMRGDKALAQDYTYYLLGKGYFEPGFVNFCTVHELCGQ